jgi:hypothetical protein
LEVLNTPTALVVCTTKQDLKGPIGKALGQVGDLLYKHGSARVQELQGRELRFAHKRQLPGTGEGMPILAILPTRDVLTTLDGLPDVGALIVIPFNEQEAEEWRNARQPQVIGAPVSQAPIPTPLAPIVVRALDGLLAMLDHNRPAIDHDSDKALVIQTFRALQEANIPYDPSAVRAHFASHGLHPKQADAIRTISQDPRKPRIKANVYPSTADLLNNWKNP